MKDKKCEDQMVHIESTCYTKVQSLILRPVLGFVFAVGTWVRMERQDGLLSLALSFVILVAGSHRLAAVIPRVDLCFHEASLEA